MNIKSPRSTIFTVLMLLFVFVGSVNAQYTLTGNVNASTLSCSTFTGSNVINIGDGTTSTSLVMNALLDLYNSCALGPVQFIVRNNASIDFSSGNQYLILPLGSSLVIEAGGNLLGGNCTASERIYIGTDLIGSCNGKGPGADFSFDDIVNNGGYNYVRTIVAPICGSGSTSISVVLIPTPTASTTYKLFSALSGGNAISSVIATSAPYSSVLTTPVISSTTIYYIEATTGSKTTPRRAVTVTVNPRPAVTNSATAITCSGTGPNIGLTASAPSSFSWTIGTITGSITGASAGSGSTINQTLTNPSNTAAGTVQYLVTPTSTTGTCAGAAFTITVTVNPRPAVTNSATAITCSGTGPNIGLTASAPSSFSWTIGTITGSITGASAGSGSTINQILTNPSNTAAGTVQYLVTSTSTTGTCAGAAFTITVTVNPRPAAPTIGTPNQPTCTISTGSVFLSGLPAGMWTINQAGQAVNTINGSGATTTISGLAVGNYTFTVDNGSCTSNASDPLTITDVNITTNRWTGSWDNGKPTLDQKIVFETTYDSNEDVIGCSCVVNSGVDVKVGSGATMKIVNQVEVYGTLTFENNASLVQISDNAVNSGTITYKRTTPTILKTDYVYWSTPVADAKLEKIQTGTLYYSFNATVNNWTRAYASTPMETGKGYIVRGAGTWFDTGSVTLTPNFIGAPNNGVKTVEIVGDRSNLIGNPYPSALDADAFIKANTNTSALSNALAGSLYFWTHKSAIKLASEIRPGTAGSGTYAYTSDDYATYNLTGGTAGNKINVGKDTDPANTPSGKIAAGQAFFAAGSGSGGTAKFNNSMRLVGGASGINNSQFFRPGSASKASNSIEKNRVWLNLTNDGGAFKQTLIGYITGATNEFDNVYDGVSFNANAFIDFYSINKGKNLVIQGRALPFDDNDTVPLGYKTTIIGEFKIAIDEADGFLANKKIILEDKLLDKTQDLSEAAYTFTTEKGTFNDRFVLSYANKTLATADFEAVENRVVITNKNKEVKISTPENQIEAVFIYDILGIQIYTKANVDKNELVVTNLIARDQVLIVKVVMKDKSIITKKTMY